MCGIKVGLDAVNAGCADGYHAGEAVFPVSESMMMCSLTQWFCRCFTIQGKTKISSPE